MVFFVIFCFSTQNEKEGFKGLLKRFEDSFVTTILVLCVVTQAVRLQGN